MPYIVRYYSKLQHKYLKFRFASQQDAKRFAKELKYEGKSPSIRHVKIKAFGLRRKKK